MYLLTIGSDRNLFKENSDVWSRYLDYGKLFEEIHVIVFSSKWLGNKKTQIGDNVFVYPTNHVFKCFYLWSIYRVARPIILNFKSSIFNNGVVVSSQDAFESGLAGWMIKKIFSTGGGSASGGKIPLQIQIHTDFLNPYFWQESFMNKIRVLLAKFLVLRADGVRVVSERIRQSLIRNWKLEIRNFRIDVLPIYVDVENIKNAPIKTNLHKKYPQFDFIILMASRLSKEKNIGLAIEALAELKKMYPKLGLVICGKGPELNKLKVKSSKLKVGDNVKFEGWSGDLISYYKTADLYLLTSNYEGYCRSVVEAMAAGLPVVMSDVGLAGEVVINGESGLVFPVADKKAAIAAIESLILNKNKRNELGVNTIKTIEKLMTKEQYLKLYKQSIESCIFNR